MALPAGVNRRYAIFAFVSLFLVWMWVGLDRPGFSRSVSGSGLGLGLGLSWEGWGTDVEDGEGGGSRRDVFDFPPLESQPIREVCGRTEWNSSLLFTCDNNHGGVGHVRNSVLNCVRFAIAAGGGLVLPNIALREMEEDHAHEEDEGGRAGDDEDGYLRAKESLMPAAGLARRHGPGRRGMDYMFDTSHFIASLTLSCPQMRIYTSLDSYYSPRRRALQPESLVRNLPVSGLEHPDLWRAQFYDWVEEHVESGKSEHDESIVVDLEQSFLSWPTHFDGHHFAHAFGWLLKPRKDVRRLATEVLHRLYEYQQTNVDYLDDGSATPGFLGAHLKTTEEPAWEAWKTRRSITAKRHSTPQPFMHFEGQATAYLEQASMSGLPVLYAASGNLTSITQLNRQAFYFNVHVTSKEDLLSSSPHSLKQLRQLRWDQRALVDMLVLEKAEQFAGVGHSAFSWNVALKRGHPTQDAHDREGHVEKGSWVDEMYRYGGSTLYGVRESYVESAECMWE